MTTFIILRFVIIWSLIFINRFKKIILRFCCLKFISYWFFLWFLIVKIILKIRKIIKFLSLFCFRNIVKIIKVYWFLILFFFIIYNWLWFITKLWKMNWFLMLLIIWLLNFWCFKWIFTNTFRFFLRLWKNRIFSFFKIRCFDRLTIISSNILKLIKLKSLIILLFIFYWKIPTLSDILFLLKILFSLKWILNTCIFLYFLNIFKRISLTYRNKFIYGCRFKIRSLKWILILRYFW